MEAVDMTSHSRRGFVKLAAATAAAGALPALDLHARSAATTPTFDLGIASYTFRSFSLDQTIAMTERLRIKKLTLKDMHLPMAITAEEMAAVHAKLKAAGLTLSSCGVVYMTTEEEVNKAFAYARLAGIRMMVGVPDAPLLDLAERKCKETDISLAIHNHGPTDKRFPSPESAYSVINRMDRRMGLCIDVGHTQRLGLDPAAQVERYFDRLLDVHIKDVSAANAEGTTVEIGSGVIDTPKLLRTLARLKYTGTLHFEHEKDAKDPFPGVAESVGYVRGVLAAL
jgi:inosose dehydratase